MNTNDFGIDSSFNFADPREINHTEFRMYLGTLSIQEKVSYLQFLETNFRNSISDNYRSIFKEIDPVLLTVEPVEVSTRILFIFSDLNE
jgi:hypothetical protein